jgi:ribosomal protein L11 methylase PrmA
VRTGSHPTRKHLVTALVILLLSLRLSEDSWAANRQSEAPAREPDVVYIPTPYFVVYRMLKLAQPKRRDMVYDLGCGDGRILIEAAKLYGARGVGLDIDPERIAESEANAQAEGVADRVQFRLQDLFQANISEASVVTLYLLPELNLRLRPKLWKELAVGTRIVSHGYPMGDWLPDRVDLVTGHPIYIWTITEEIKKGKNSRTQELENSAVELDASRLVRE